MDTVLIMAAKEDRARNCYDRGGSGAAAVARGGRDCYRPRGTMTVPRPGNAGRQISKSCAATRPWQP